MRWLRQSTSVDLPIGPFLDSTDGVTAETALTLTQPDVRLKKNGAAWGQKAAAQTLTHEENGNYEVTLDATDTDTLGLLRLHVAESGALPVWDDFLVLPANVYDSLVAASSTLLVNAAAAFTTQMTEAYAADGVAPTPAQALFLIMQRLTEFSIASTTITIKKLDGSTTAATLTLDSSSAPTSSTRSG